MIVRILGSVLILIGCSGFGVMISLAYKREEEMLRQMIHSMDYIQCELQFHMTPLPDLCIQASNGCKGRISKFWKALSQELFMASSPDVAECVAAVREITGPYPSQVDKVLDMLSASLGQFDAQGQIHSLEAAREHCRAALEAMGDNRENKLRSYQTLGICTGVALVILLV